MEQMKIGCISSIPSFEVKSQANGELFTLCRSLATAAEFGGIEVMCEELHPGHRASAPHSHSGKNELSIVMRGEVLAHVDGEQHILNAGDYALFNGGEGRFHFFENTSQDVAVILTISSNHENDIVEYSRSIERVS